MGLRDYFKKYFEKHSAFFEGMGNLSLFPAYKKLYWMNDNLTPEEQDALAIKGDWEKVGNDLRNAINHYKKSLDNKIKN